MLDARLVLYRTFLTLEYRVRKLAKQDPVCQRLMTAPGVGPITALTFKAGVDDPTRFKHSRTVAANAMMTRSSQWSPLKTWGMKLAKTRGHKRAVIADARKLAFILHRLWIDDT